jgi:hypothetical protein
MNVGARTLGLTQPQPSQAQDVAKQAVQNQACGTDEGHATGHPHAYDYTPLQQARGTEACNRINNRYRLPLEDPAGHGIAQRRVANVDYLHMSPQNC